MAYGLAENQRSRRPWRELGSARYRIPAAPCAAARR